MNCGVRNEGGGVGWGGKGVSVEPGFISGQAIHVHIPVKMEFACPCNRACGGIWVMSSWIRGSLT